MASLGMMTAYVGLDYSNMMRGLGYTKSQLSDLQTYTVRVQGATSANAGRVAAGAAVAVAAMSRSSRGMFGGLMAGSLGVVGSLAKLGMTAATTYSGWRLNSLRMKNELLQSQVLLNMLGKGPAGGGAGTLSWLAQVRGGAASTRAGMNPLLRNTLLVGAAIAGLGAAAVYGYGVWRAQSTRMNAQLQQQRAMARMASGSGGIGVGGIAAGSLIASAIGNGNEMVKQGVVEALKLASDAEQATISFEVMMGSASKAKMMLAELKAYADTSSFGVAGANAAAQRLMNYNIQAQDVMPTIRMLGDVAAGDADKFDRLATAFGQTSSTGRLMGSDLLQFINAGFNPLQEISKKTGESMTQLKKRMEDGGISALEVRDAFVAATSEGGRFYGMTERQAGTVAGKFSTMKDAASTALRGLGEAMMTNLNIKGWIEYVTAGLNRVPFLFNNAGTLVQAELLGWNIYLMELVPGVEGPMLKVGAIIVATWDGLTASFHLFIESVKGGLIEIMNLASAAAGGATKAASGLAGHVQTSGMNIAGGLVSGGLQGAGSAALGEMWNWSTGGLTQSGGPNLINNLTSGFTETLANQQDVMQPGTDFASTFAEKFSETMAAAAEGTDTTTWADKLRQQRAELLKTIIPPEALKPADFGGVPGASFNSSTEGGKNKTNGASNAESSAAMIASTEAAKIMTSGFGSKIQSEQLATLKRIELKIGPKPLQPQSPRFAPSPTFGRMEVEATNL